MIDPYAQEVLNTLDNFDDYMSQLEVIADMGSGAGHHARWWANKEPIKGNKQKKYIVLAVDDTVSIDNKNRQNNIRQVRKDWADTGIQRNMVDLVWCHDSFDQAVDPFATLRHWHSIMCDNAMLVMSVRQNAFIDDLSRWQIEIGPSSYYSWNMTTLMKALATCGFDCREGFLRQRRHDPYLWAAVYKSKHQPSDLRSTSWYDLMDKQLVPVSAEACIMKFGYVKQDMLVLEWLDRQRHDLAVEMMP